jgi:ABC-2 type transport system permease protein
MSTIQTLIKKEIFEFIKLKKMFILVCLLCFIAISSPIMANLMPIIFKNIQTPGITINIPDPTWMDSIDQLVKNISQIAVICLIFIYAGAISEDKNKKSLELLLSKPIRRRDYILSKFLSSLLINITCILLTFILFFSYSSTLFGEGSFNSVAILFVLLFLFLQLITNISILISSISSSQIASAAISFIIYILIVTLLPFIKSTSDYLPDFVLRNYKDIFTGFSFGDFMPSIVLTILCIFIIPVVSVMLFQNQEIER